MNELNETLQNAIWRLTTGNGSLKTLQYDACLVALHGKLNELEDAKELFEQHDLNPTNTGEWYSNKNLSIATEGE